MRRDGSVIILTIWTMFFLGAIVIAVAARVDGAIRVASWFKTSTESYELARAGVEKVIIEVISDTNVWDGVTEAWCREDSFKNVGVGGGSFSVWHKVLEAQGATTVVYGVIDEESRININQAGKEVLVALVMTACEVDSATAGEIAAATLDWQDPDDDMLTGGAEKNYYESLDVPVRCHNGEFQSVYELLLVKGVEPALFEKIEPFVTVYGTGKVNLNTAGTVVLAALAAACGGDGAACASLAQKIVSFRRDGNMLMTASAADIGSQIRQAVRLTPDEENLLFRMMPYLALQSTCFRGTSEGVTGGGETENAGAGRRIEFVFDRTKQSRVFWYEN